jgi:hypothetical protein
MGMVLTQVIPVAWPSAPVAQNISKLAYGGPAGNRIVVVCIMRWRELPAAQTIALEVFGS